MALTPELIEKYGKAVAQLQAGALDEAESLLADVLAAVPDQAESLHLMGALEQQRSRPVQALDWLGRAAAMQPDNPEIAMRIGMSAHHTGDSARALDAFDQALALRPDLPLALNGRSIALAALGRHDESRQVMDRALELDPRLIALHDVRVGDRLKVCDWRGLDDTRRRIVSVLDDGGLPCEPADFLLLADDPDRWRTLVRRFAGQAYPAAVNPLWSGEKYHHERLRLAFLTSGIEDHPLAHPIIQVLENLDRTRFEVSVFSWSAREPGALHERIKAACDHFRDVRDLASGAIAGKVRAGLHDVAITLDAYGRGAMPDLMAMRCAPVQVSYLGFPGTPGAPYIDYIMADETVIPPAGARLHDEAVVWMPGSFQPGEDAGAISPQPSRAPGAVFVFRAAGEASRITPDQFGVWMRILARAPASVLSLADPGAYGQENLRREARERGVEPDRLIFTPGGGRDQDLLHFQTCDLMLDTLPCNAGGAAGMALAAGLPVLTCPGKGLPARTAASLLRAAGMEVLIAPSPAAYEALAIELALQPDLVNGLRRTLIRNRGTAPLFDVAAHARDLGYAFQTMVERRRMGLPPESFHVTAL